MKQILDYLNNYFFIQGEKGTFTITDNKIIVSQKYLQGQYIYLTGSIMNDNIYRIESINNNEITIVGANNEVFEGVIYSLAIPPTIIELEGKIKEWNLGHKPTNLQSETFGNYSYTMATVNGKLASWKDVFQEELKPYRKLYSGIERVKVI